MSEFNGYKGYISKEHTIWCGGCPQLHRDAIVPTRAAMARVMRAQGWKFTKEHGWLCRSCGRRATHER